METRKPKQTSKSTDQLKELRAQTITSSNKTLASMQLIDKNNNSEISSFI